MVLLMLPPVGGKPPAFRFRRRRFTRVESRLFESTNSKRQKQQGRRLEDDRVPFVPGGGAGVGKTISDRSPGLFQDSYDSIWDAQREDRMSTTSRFLNGAFVPASVKPRTVQPLQTRAQTAGVTGALSRTGSQEAPGLLMAQVTAPAGFGMDTRFGSISSTDFGFQEHMGRAGEGGKRKSRSGRANRASSSAPGTSQPERTPRDEKSEPGTAFGIPIAPAQISDTWATQQRKSAEKKAVAEAQDTQTKALFKKLADEGKLHQDDLSHALSLLGCACPRKDWITEVLVEITRYTTIDYNEFLDFWELYSTKQRNAYMETFKSFDADGSGSVDTGELKDLFNSLGIEPMTHVLQEVVDEVDVDHTGNLDFNEFERVMETLQRREGFTKSEYDEIKSLFQRFDRDCSGTMEVTEIQVALQWLGFPCSTEETAAIVDEIDKDKSGQIDENEWLMCMRTVREKKLQQLREVIKEHDEDGSGTIQYHEIEGLIRALGFVPDSQAVAESAKEADISENDDDLDLSELWRLLKVFRDREGLTEEELNEIGEAFNRHAKEGEVAIVDVGKVVRSVGYTLPFETQQKMVREVDIDSSGKLDIMEFRKMIRIVHKMDLDVFYLTFHEVAGTTNRMSSLRGSCASKGGALAHRIAKRMRRAQKTQGITINVQEAITGLTKVLGMQGMADGRTFEELLPAEQLEDDEIDYYGFVMAALHGQAQKRAAFRESGGFNDAEVARLKELFQGFDNDKSGEISGAEVIRLLEQEFPTLAGDANKRPQIQQVLKDADENGSGSLDFQDFLRAMRCFKDMHEQLQIGKELAAVTETNFSASEVQEFRELYLASASGSTELDFDKVREMMEGIVPMGARNIDILKRKFLQVANRDEGVHGESEMLDFPEFLWLMRALLNMNFANMAGELGKR